MKWLVLIPYAFAFVVNLLCGLMFDGYARANLVLSSGVLLVGLLLSVLAVLPNLKDAFRLALSCLFGVASLIGFVVALIASPTLSGNGCLVFILVLVGCQWLLYAAAFFASRRNPD